MRAVAWMFITSMIRKRSNNRMVVAEQGVMMCRFMLHPPPFFG
jgi:hypothetical protein